MARKSRSIRRKSKTSKARKKNQPKTLKFVEKNKYIVQDFKNPPKSAVLKYRRIKSGGHLVTLALLKKRIARRKWKVLSIWHPKQEFKRISNKKWLKRDIDKILRVIPRKLKKK